MSGSLGPFSGLLEHLKNCVFLKKMKPELSGTGEETDVHLAARYRSMARDEAHNIARPRFGLPHAVRSIALAEQVVRYCQQYGNPELKAYIAQKVREFGEERFIQMLQCTIAFADSGRESHISRRDQPQTYQLYRERDGKRLQGAFHTGDSKTRIVRDLFPSVGVLAEFKTALVELGDPSKTDPLHVLLNMAHKLDQHRYLNRWEANQEINSYFSTHSEDDSGQAILKLNEYAHGLLSVTHDTDRSAGRNHRQAEWTFQGYTKSVSRCSRIVESVRAPTFQSRAPLAKEWMNSPYYFKVVSSSVNQIYMNGSSLSPIHVDPDSLRVPKRSWVSRIKDRRIQKHSRWDGRYKSNRDSSKPYHSKAQSLSTADPMRGFCSKRYDPAKSAILVGCLYAADEVQLSRIALYGTSTYARAHEAHTAESLDQTPWSRTEFDSLEASITPGSSGGQIIEAMGRVSEPSAIAVFKDNLFSRIVAQARAKRMAERFNMREEEFGRPRGNKTYEIIFHEKLSDASFGTFYSPEEQTADRRWAEKLLRVGNEYGYLKSDWVQLRQAMAELNRPARPSRLKDWGVTPFQVQCANGKLPRPLNAGEINYQDKRGYTALHYAAANGHITLLKMLLRVDDIKVAALSNKHETRSYALTAG